MGHRTSHLCDRLTKPKYAAPTQMSSGIADAYNIDTKSTMRHSPYLSAGFHACNETRSARHNRTRCATQRHLSERRNGGPSNAMLSCFCVREFLHARCLKPTDTQAGALKHRSARQERQHESERTARTRKLTRTGCAAPPRPRAWGQAWTSAAEKRPSSGIELQRR